MTEELFILTQKGKLIRYSAIAGFNPTLRDDATKLNCILTNRDVVVLGEWDTNGAATEVMMGIVEWVKSADSAHRNGYFSIFHIPASDEALCDSASMKYKYGSH